MSPSVRPASSRTRFRSPSGRVCLVGPDRHRPKFRRPERSHHRHIERIAAPSNQHPTDSPGVVAGIESPPPVAQPHLHPGRSEEHTSELQSQSNLVCRLLLEKKTTTTITLMAFLSSTVLLSEQYGFVPA